jgi:PQQ-dependent catabolism-associated CXXCW motif protein
MIGRLSGLVALAGQLGVAVAAPDLDARTGYRTGHYRAPVTRPVEGGTRVDLAGLDRLRASGAVAIDVMPQRGGYDPETGAWRMVDRRDTIPGAIWLPEVGRGMLEPRLVAYLAGALARLTHGDKGHAIVFFCMADCWMSWNAVKRTAALGYTRVYWFADGTDGWREADRSLAPATPLPVPALEGQ